MPARHQRASICLGERLERRVLHLMKSEVNNSRLRFIVRWAPLLFAITSLWAILSWRHQFASVSYLLACILVGIVCGALIIADFRPDSSPLLYPLWFLIFLSAPIILGEFVFADLKAKGMMFMSNQICLGCIEFSLWSRYHSATENSSKPGAARCRTSACSGVAMSGLLC